MNASNDRYVPAPVLAGEADARSDSDQLGLNFEVGSLEWKALPHQYDALEFLARADDAAVVRRLALLGGWGSGKSRGAAMAFVAACAAEPWREEYGEQNPLSVIVAPTYRVLRQATLVALESVMSRDIVMKRRGPPYNDLLLSNGHRILLYSGEGELEGLNLVNLWVDEISHPTFDQNRFANYTARCREPRARRLNVIVSGLASFGWVRDVFDHPETATQKTILCGTEQNTHIRAEVLESIRAAVPAGADYLLKAGWQPAPNAVYPQFEPRLHIVDRELDTRRPVNISFDVGNQAAILVSQRIPVKLRNIVGKEEPGEGLLVGAELVPDGCSVDELCYKFKTTFADFRVVPGESVITTDPTTDKDEERAIRRHFPNVRYVQRKKGDPQYAISFGARLVQRGLRDSMGNTRLYFSAALRKHGKRGILDSVPKLRYREGTDVIVKDNSSDHCADALRYAVCELLPESRSVVRVIPGGL